MSQEQLRRPPNSILDVTIGEALEVTAIGAADKPIDQSDAAAIQEAEMRATGNEVSPGGIGADAQSAASRNPGIPKAEDKISLSDLLTDATGRLPSDRNVTLEDAEGVIGAEIKHSPETKSTPNGVGASMAAAARLNEGLL